MNAEIVRIARSRGCAKCVAWAPHGSGQQAGECRISPPRTSATNRWPVTSPGDFCAEWLPVEEPVTMPWQVQANEEAFNETRYGGPFSEAARRGRGEEA